MMVFSKGALTWARSGPDGGVADGHADNLQAPGSQSSFSSVDDSLCVSPESVCGTRDSPGNPLSPISPVSPVSTVSPISPISPVSRTSNADNGRYAFPVFPRCPPSPTLSGAAEQPTPNETAPILPDRRLPHYGSTDRCFDCLSPEASSDPSDDATGLVSHRATTTTSRTISLCVACVLTGSAANVGFVEMGRAMPDSPAFLVCTSTLLTAVLFGLWWGGWAWRGRDKTRDEGRGDEGGRGDQQGADRNGGYLEGDRGDNDDPSLASSSQCISPPSASPAGCCFATGIWSRLCQTRPQNGSLRLPPPPHHRPRLWAHYCGIAVLAAGSSFLAQLANTHVSGPYQSLIGQMHLPFTVAMSRVVVGQRYSWPQHLGAAIVLLATCLPFVWDMAGAGSGAGGSVGGDDSAGGANGDACRTSDGASLLWAIALGASQLPVALTSIWEQHLLGPTYSTHELHYLTCTTGLSFALLVAMALVWDGDVLGPAAALAAFFGHAAAWMSTATFVASTVVYYYCLAALCKDHSATFQVMVNAMVTPVSAVAFGFLGQPLSPLAWLACGIVPAGVVLYQCDGRLVRCLRAGGRDNGSGNEEDERIRWPDAQV